MNILSLDFKSVKIRDSILEKKVLNFNVAEFTSDNNFINNNLIIKLFDMQNKQKKCII